MITRRQLQNMRRPHQNKRNDTGSTGEECGEFVSLRQRELRFGYVRPRDLELEVGVEAMVCPVPVARLKESTFLSERDLEGSGTCSSKAWAGGSGFRGGESKEKQEDTGL